MRHRGLHRHEFQHVALDLHLAREERLHCPLWILLDKDGSRGHVVGGERRVDLVEVTEVHDDLTRRRVHVAVNYTVPERHVGDHLVEAHDHGHLGCLIAILLTNRTCSLHPLGREKWVGHLGILC